MGIPEGRASGSKVNKLLAILFMNTYIENKNRKMPILLLFYDAKLVRNTPLYIFFLFKEDLDFATDEEEFSQKNHLIRVLNYEIRHGVDLILPFTYRVYGHVYKYFNNDKLISLVRSKTQFDLIVRKTTIIATLSRLGIAQSWKIRIAQFDFSFARLDSMTHIHAQSKAPCILSERLYAYFFFGNNYMYIHSCINIRGKLRGVRGSTQPAKDPCFLRATKRKQ